MLQKLFHATPAEEPGDAGFTLIEMLVVVSIIGVLAAVAIPRYMAYAKSSKTAEVANTAGALIAAMTAYADGQGSSAAATFTSAVGLDYDASPTPATDLTQKIPGFVGPSNSKYNFTVTTATGAAGGPQANDTVFCVIARARDKVGLTKDGVVVFSSTPSTAADWDGRINRKLMDTATTGAPSITAGGYCSTAGAAQAAFN